MKIETEKTTFMDNHSKRKQYFLVFLCVFVYLSNYLCRYSYLSNSLPLQEAYGITPSQFGVPSALFYICYGSTQIILSFFISKLNKRYSITIPLLIEAIVTLVIYFAPPFEAIIPLWGVVGVCSAFLWPSLLGVLSDNLEESVMRQSSSLMTFSTLGGIVATYLLAPMFLNLGNFRWMFLLGGSQAIFAATLFFILSFQYRVGKAQPRKVEQPQPELYERKTKPKNSFLFIGFLCLLAFLTCIVGDTLNIWFPNIISTVFKKDKTFSTVVAVLLPLLGITGSYLNLFFRNKRKLGTCVSSIIFLSVSLISFAACYLFLGKEILIGFLVFAALARIPYAAMNNNATSYAPLVLRNYYSSSRLASLINGIGYIGSIVASLLMPKLAEQFGWAALFAVLFSLAAFFILLTSTLFLCFRKKPEYSDFL